MAITTESLAAAILEALPDDAKEVPTIYKEVMHALANPEDPRFANMIADALAPMMMGSPITCLRLIKQTMASLVIGGYQLGLKDAEVGMLEKMAGEGTAN